MQELKVWSSVQLPDYFTRVVTMVVNFRPSPCYQWCHSDQCFLSRKQFLILCISYSLWSCHSRAGTSIFGILYWPWTTSECCSCCCEYFCGLSLSFIYINFQSGHTWIAVLHQCKIRSWDCLQVCLTFNLIKLANSIHSWLVHLLTTAGFFSSFTTNLTYIFFCMFSFNLYDWC